MSKTTADDVIPVLKTIFSVHGFPSESVTDNGSPFDSVKFKTYCSNSSIF